MERERLLRPRRQHRRRRPRHFFSAAANLPERRVAVDFDFLGETEHPFADDVALDLVGTPADRCKVGIERQKVRNRELQV